MKYEVRSGSGVLLVLLLLSGTSLLLMSLHMRTSFILRTVIERESYLKLRYAAEGLLCYAIGIAKQNWAQFYQQEAQQVKEYTLAHWPIDSTKEGSASISYKKVDGEVIKVEATLISENVAQIQMWCMVMPVNEVDPQAESIDTLEIIQWQIL